MGESEILEGEDIHMTEDKYLTVAELSEYLHVHKTTIYRMLKEENCLVFALGATGDSVLKRLNNGSSIR